LFVDRGELDAHSDFLYARMHKFLMLNELEKRKIIKKKFGGMMFSRFGKRAAVVRKFFIFVWLNF
jgi:hypothetical protein